jgi:hypothetical protein
MAENKKLPKYERIKTPPAMRLTERDRRIMEAIHAYDGMLGFSQLKRLFFTGESQAKYRLMLLYQNGYLDRLDQAQRRKVPEMIYWLDNKGAQLVASLYGTPFKEFLWRKQPRWFQMEHDLVVNDFRLDIEAACDNDPDIDMQVWIAESEFWSDPDRVSYTYRDHQYKRNIRPDGYFMLSTPEHYLRYLLEIDRSTEDNPRFYREKILPGLAYVKSDAYEQRFGHKTGRWLVVTTGERRLNNMLRQAQRAKTKGLFYFTTFERISANTILRVPIWQREDRDELVPLVIL